MFIENEISNRYKKDKKDYNKKNIEELFEKGGNEEIKEFLNLKIVDLYQIYLNNKENKYKDIFGLDYDLKYRYKKEDDGLKEYIEKCSKELLTNLEKYSKIK